MLNLLLERMGAVGVPVLGTHGQPIAALSVAALSDRISSRLEQLVAWLQEEAVGIAMPASRESKTARTPARKRKKAVSHRAEL